MFNTDIAFQTKNTPEKTFILGFIFVYVSFGVEKKDENIANAALNVGKVLEYLFNYYHGCSIKSLITHRTLIIYI